MHLPAVFEPGPDMAPYVPQPRSARRIKVAFRVDFTNGGYVEGEDFLLDIPDSAAEPTPARLAELIVSAMNLLRAGPVTVRRMEVVERGSHDDSAV